MKEIKYNFKYINECNFCCADKSNFKILGKRLNSSQGKNPRNKIGITTTVVKCKKCNLIFSNPQPIPEHIEDHYGIPPENYWKPEYFQIDNNYMSYEIKWLNRLMPTQKEMKVLDIGAGIGKAMKVFESNGYNTYGIEPSKTFYTKAIEKLHIDKSKLQNVSIEEAEFENEIFDFISFGAVLEHLYDPSASIQKTLNWLKPNGLIHIEVPSSDWLINKLSNIYYRLSGLDYVGNISPMHEPFHLYEFALKSFQKNAEINNYKIVDFKYWICNTYLPKIFNMPLRKYMELTNSGMQLVIWIRKA